MSLDLFTGNIDDAVNYAARVSAPELPSTFSDNFNDAWNKGYLTSQSISGEIRKTRARSELVDSAIAKTGDQSFGQIERDGFLDPQIFNAKLAEHKARRPDLDVQPISDEAIQARADEIGKAQLATSADFARRERTAGGTFGHLVGAAAAAVADPVNLIAFPLAAPESLGILGTALAWGGIGAGSQTLIEALNATSMERIQPGYGASGQPITNILETAAGGAVLGGAIKGLASAWTRAKTGSWPRTVRDAGNVVESEAQIAGTNPLPGVEGEAAHRTALNKAIDDLANGRPVDVEGIVTPGQLAALDERAAPVLAAKDAALEAQQAARAAADEVLATSSKPPELPFAQTALEAQAELHTGTLTQGIQDIARLAGHDMPADEAAKIAARISQLNDPDKARAVLDEVFLRPQTIADTLPAVERPVKPTKDTTSPDAVNAMRDELTPAKIEEARLHPDLAETVSRDLDKLLAERQIQTPRKMIDVPNAQPYLREQLERTWNLAQEMRVIDDIEQLAAEGKTAMDIQKELGSKLDRVRKLAELNGEFPENAVRSFVREVRTGLGIPSVDQSDFTTWLAAFNERKRQSADFEVPMGVTVDAEGRTVPNMVKVEDVVAEADARLAAAKEIEACVGPYPNEAAA